MSLNVPVCCCIALLLAMPVRLSGQDSLAAARQLYAAAEYHNALAMLGALLAANPSPQERQSIELYRVFCLFALNSVDDANGALEAMILRDPLYRPSNDIVPRRLRPAFTDARKRLLPTIIQEKYVVAKAAFDRGDYNAAAAGFTQTLMTLSDPDIAAEAEQRPLADLRVLATGFQELAVRALAPPAAPEVQAQSSTGTPPTGTLSTGTLPTGTASAAASAPRPSAARLSPARPSRTEPPARTRTPAIQATIYEAGSAGVTVPIALRQDMPPFPVKIVSPKTGELEVVIDETGAVESATIVTSLEPRYNLLLLAAAKAWRYRPATVDGAPVKFRKRIQMTLSPTR